MFAREIELFPDDDLVWKTVPGVSNSAGNLALHVCGNVKHFIGHALGGTSYVRNRELEFSTHSGTRAELVRELRSAIDVVNATFPGVSEATMSGDYPEMIDRTTLKTHLILVHLVSHLGFHLGQAGYLRRVLTGENRSAGGMDARGLTGAR